MVEIGFGAFLEKIEEHFGKGVLKMLLMLIGLAVALFCSKLIWDIALGPLVGFISETFAGGILPKEPLRYFWNGAALVAGVLLSGYLANLNNRIWRDKLREADSLEAVVKARLERDPESLNTEEIQAALKLLEKVGKVPMGTPSPEVLR